MQTITLANLKYYAKQTRKRIAECDRMVRQKKQETTFTKEEKAMNKMRPPQQKTNKP